MRLEHLVYVDTNETLKYGIARSQRFITTLFTNQRRRTKYQNVEIFRHFTA